MQVQATALGFDGICQREVGQNFEVPEHTVPGRPAWFVATDDEGKKKLEANQAAADYETAKQKAGLARRATDKAPAVEALKPQVKDKSLKELQAEEAAIEKSRATDGVLASDLV